MFDLEKEVAAWSRAVHADRCRTAGSVAELRDHLYCEIDRLRAQGLSNEQAFRAAIATLGPETQLAAEHAKNRSWFGRVCATLARIERQESRGVRRDLLVAHAFIWASLMIATSLLLSKSATRDALSYVIIFVFVPLWWCSEQILRRAMRTRNDGAR